MSVRIYVPATIAVLAELASSGGLTPGDDVVTAEDDSEEAEYAALVTAAEASAVLVAGLPDGRRRRVVVVAEVTDPVADPAAAVPLRDVVAVHADPADDADPDDDLGWYATQALGSLL